MINQDFLVNINIDQIRNIKNRYPNELFLYLFPFIKCGLPLDEVLELSRRSPSPVDILIKDIKDSSNDEKSTLYTHVDHFVDIMMESNELLGRSFFFYGANSAGKTFAACYIVANLIRQYAVYYINFKDLYNAYNEASYKDNEDAMNLLSYIMNCDILVIDELGKENVSPALLSTLELLIKKRANSLLTTIICSNINIGALPLTEESNEFIGRYGNSIFEALQKKYYFFQFSKNGNFRTKARNEL